MDDALWGHPKWMAANARARALWVTAGSWCSAHLTDGYVPESALKQLHGTRKDAQILVKVGLWVEVESGWSFHGFLERNPSKEQVEGVRAAARERAAARRSRELRAPFGAPYPTQPNPSTKPSMGPTGSPPAYPIPDAAPWLTEHRAIEPTAPPADLRQGLKPKPKPKP